MCGRFTRQYTWEELVRLYRLTEDYFKPNLQPRYNICPTTTIDTVVEHDGSGRSNQCAGASSLPGGNISSRK
jgi:putative SOS response-associated peptidase YedK